MVFVGPTWCGPPSEGEARIAPFLKLGTLLAGAVDSEILWGVADRIRPVHRQWATDVHGHVLASCARRQEHRRLHTGDGDGRLSGLRHLHPRIQGRRLAGTGRERRPSVFAATTYWSRFSPRSSITRTQLEEQRHRQWVRATLRAFDAIALPGGYPNFLARGDADRAAKSYGRNAERLIKAKQHYDPDNVFRSAIPLPVSRPDLRLGAAAL